MVLFMISPLNPPVALFPGTWGTWFDLVGEHCGNGVVDPLRRGERNARVKYPGNERAVAEGFELLFMPLKPLLDCVEDCLAANEPSEDEEFVHLGLPNSPRGRQHWPRGIPLDRSLRRGKPRIHFHDLSLHVRV